MTVLKCLIEVYENRQQNSGLISMYIGSEIFNCQHDSAITSLQKRCDIYQATCVDRLSL